MYFKFTRKCRCSPNNRGWSKKRFNSSFVVGGQKEDAEFSFKVGVKQVKVYCHRENGKWIACEECSRLGGEAGAETNEISASRSPEGLTAKGGTV